MARTIPGYPDPKRLVRDPSARVTLDNTAQEVRSVSLTRSMGTGLPAQVAGVDDMVAATGEVTIRDPKLSGTLVYEGFNLPWGKQPGVRAGQGVNIDLGDGDALTRVLTGRVEDVDSAATLDELSFSVVDRIDRFDREVSIPPLSERHPSPEGFDHMRIKLHPTFVTNWLARHSSFYATPPLQTNTMVSAPMMGSSWPERGTIVQSSAYPISDVYPQFSSTQWGLAANSLNALYRPNVDVVNGKLDRPMFVHFLAEPPNPNQVMQTRLDWPSGEYLRVRLVRLSGGALKLSVDRLTASHVVASGTEFDLTGVMDDGGSEVEVWIEPDGSVTLRIDGVAISAMTANLSPSSEMRTTALSGVLVSIQGDSSDASARAFGGLQVGQALVRDLSAASGAWERTAIIETDPTNALQNVPTIVKRNTLALLKEQAAAELASMWIDGDGRFRYRSRERTLNAEPTFELDFDTIENMRWSMSRTSAMRKLTVKWSAPTTWRSTEHRVDVWQGNGGTIQDGDFYEEIVHPDADVDWIDVDPPEEMDNDANAIWRFNRGWGSWVSGILLDQDNPDVSQRETPAPPSHYQTGFQRIDARSYLIRVVPVGLNGRDLVLRSPSYPTMTEARRGVDTPILRARGRVKWDEQDTVIFDRTGQGVEYRDLPEYVHDAGVWVQSLANATALGNTLAGDVDDVTPVMDNVMISFDDQIELADVGIIRTPDGYADLRVLVVKVEDAFEDKKRTQTLALQVIDIQEAN